MSLREDKKYVTLEIFSSGRNNFGDNFPSEFETEFEEVGEAISRRNSLSIKRPQAGLLGVSDWDQNGGSRDGVSASGAHGGGRWPSGLPRCDS